MALRPRLTTSLPFRESLEFYSNDPTRTIRVAESRLRSPTPPLHCFNYWCDALPLLVGNHGDKLAAEGRDIRDDAAPDHVAGN